MITPSPCFMSALRGTSSGLAQNKKRYANNASYGDGHTKWRVWRGVGHAQTPLHLARAQGQRYICQNCLYP